VTLTGRECALLCAGTRSPAAVAVSTRFVVVCRTASAAGPAGDAGQRVVGAGRVVRREVRRGDVGRCGLADVGAADHDRVRCGPADAGRHLGHRGQAISPARPATATTPAARTETDGRSRRAAPSPLRTNATPPSAAGSLPRRVRCCQNHPASRLSLLELVTTGFVVAVADVSFRDGPGARARPRCPGRHLGPVAPVTRRCRSGWP